VTQPPGAGPGFTAPDFVSCYRHPERKTGISCQRCKRPICGECMNPASVGFQCPKCVTTGKAGVRQPRTAFGAVLRPGTGSTTYLLMGVLGAVWLLDLVTRGLVSNLLIMSNQLVAAGQFWRLFTASFASGTLLGTLMNLLVLWIVGRTLESELGRWRMLTLFFAGGLGGTTLLFVLAPPAAFGFAASSALIGLLAANSIFKYKQREDVRADIGLFLLLIGFSVLIGFRGFGWLMLIGGLLVGALVGAVLAYAPRDNRGPVQVVGLLGVVLLCLAAVTAKLVLF
jgi:membrane associated rhomboid family serine protease